MLVIIFILSVVLGYRRGFIQTMLQLAVWGVSFAVALFVSLPIANAIFDGWIAESMQSDISESLQDTGTSSAEEQLAEILDGLPGPIASVLENNDALSQTFLDVKQEADATVDTVSRTLVEKLVRPAVVLLLRFVIFLILFVALLFLLKFVRKLLKPLSKLPLLRTADGILGAVLGALKGIVYILAIVSIIQIVAALSPSNGALSKDVVEDTTLVSWVADRNPITNSL